MWADLKYRLRALLRRDDMDRELQDELRFHLEQAVEKLMRAGVSREEAGRRARLEFGGIDQIAEDTRAVRGVAVIDSLRQDVRYAWRGVRARPGFAAAVVLTLGLGIGANATMFGVVDRLLFRAPSWMTAPERVHRAYVNFVWNGAERSDRNFAYLTYANLRQFTTTLEHVGAFAYRTLAVGRGAEARELPVGIVSASMFDFFEARPALGRFFTAEEDVAPTGTNVAVLGYEYWRSVHHARRGVLGEQIHIGEASYTIIGVAPRGFAGTTDGRAPVAYVPLTAFAYARAPDYARDYGWSWLEILVRRSAGVTLATATADVSHALARSWEAERGLTPAALLLPSARAARVSGTLSPPQYARGPDAGPEARVATWVLGVAFVVLLIAAANVVNLLLTRAVHRQREIALRLALGVSRRRLVQQLLVETLLLALLGGAAGLIIARWGGATLRALFLRADSADAVATDARTVLFTAVLTLGIALLTGLAPALQTLRADVATTLKAGTRDSGHRASTLRTSLLIFQGGLSVLLLVGAGLFVRSLLNVRALRLGFDPEALVVVDAIMRGVQLDDAQQNALTDRLHAAAMSVPGVQSATMFASVPFSGTEGRGAPDVPGRDSLHLLGRYTLQTGSQDYFRTTGTRILRGRGFEATDRAGAQPVIVVSAALAEAIWPGEDPLGKQIRFGGAAKPMLTVVGVAEDVTSRGIGAPADLWYYLPIEQYRVMFGVARPGLLVRVQDNPEAFAERLRERLQREMPGDAYVRTMAFSQLIEPQQRSWRVGATMFIVFASLALTLAAIGLYSVVAYVVTHRTRELGIRIALGASTAGVVRMVAAQGVLFALVSIAGGSAAAVVAARRADALLFRASATDPLVYGTVAAVLLAVTCIATLRPALRATRVDPTIALRTE
jgi:predicted permease